MQSVAEARRRTLPAFGTALEQAALSFVSNSPLATSSARVSPA